MAHIAHNENGTPYIADPWDLDDFRMAAEIAGLTLTDDQLIAGMERVVKYYDTEIGINWEVIQITLSDMYEEISSC
jgi:hypothetical protein